MNEIFERMMLSSIERQLNLLPEVTWDRWAGELDEMVIFGWVERADDKRDFVMLRFKDNALNLFSTSSAKHSREFANRLGFDTTSHKECKRVEWVFKNVKTVRMPKDGDGWCLMCGAEVINFRCQDRKCFYLGTPSKNKLVTAATAPAMESETVSLQHGFQASTSIEVEKRFEFRPHPNT
jgi:hypothetical protein